MTPAAIAVGFAAAKLALHLVANGRYGYFRDELYFLACGEHLDWGYVDQAPMVALVARVSRALLGDSLPAIRFLSAVAGAAKVLLTGLLTRTLGGGRYAVMLSCLCTLVAPVYLVNDNWLSMNAFEPVLWTGCAYLVVLASVIALSGKHYYVAPAYPMLFAGGAVVWERMLEGRRRPRAALPAAIAVGGLAFAPLALPILPVETLVRYQRALGVEPPRTEVAHAGRLPQHFGDMFGWEEMVAAVARAYYALPAHERDRAAILASNYGEAGAVDLFGPRYGLPGAISPHQNYYLWGPRGYTGEVMIVLHWTRARAEASCRSVEPAETLNHPYAMAEEHYTIFVCRGLGRPLSEAWPDMKHWN